MGKKAPTPGVGIKGLSTEDLSGILALAGLDNTGTKAELLARLEDALKSGPPELGALRARIRTMEARVAALEGDPSKLKAAAPAKAPAPAPASVAAAEEVADGPTAADLEEYIRLQPPKISGKPTPEQKTALGKATAAKKDFLKKLSKRLGGKWTVKVVTKDLDKKMKASASAAKRPKEVEEKPLEPVPMAITKGGGIPSPRFGDFIRIQSACTTGRSWTQIADITPDMQGELIWLRGRKYQYRAQSKKLCFVTLRQQFNTVQCVCAANGKEIMPEMSKYVADVPNESIVDVLAKVNVPEKPIASCTQSGVELGVEAFFCASKSESRLPLQVVDAARSQKEIDEAAKKDPDAKFVNIGIDTRLNNRMLDLRTPANQAILKINAAVGSLFREYLNTQKFTEIHSPKIIPGASEGGAAIFKLQYMDMGPACLAQSPQLYKQMGVCCDLERVFEIGPVFRAENSLTNRHLCEYIGLDLEMSFKDHYHEALDVFDGLFGYIFDHLKADFAPELEAIRAQYPFEDLLYTNPMKRLTHKEAVDILRAWGAKAMPPLKERTPGWMIPYLEYEMAKANTGSDEEEPEDPGLPPLDQKQKQELLAFSDDWVTTQQCMSMDYMDDFTTPCEKQLGRIMHSEHGSDFYIVDKFPLCVRPFYTMPDPDDPQYSNSYDIFLRGEEIMSGAQRIHDPKLLVERCKAWEVPIESIQEYVDAFKFGAFPHAGGGIGLERVVMLYLGLPNIRLCTLFPRDPKRMTP